MRLDLISSRYLTKDDLKILSALENGMKKHEIVPTSNLKSVYRGNLHTGIATLARNRLVHHESKDYDGYRLTYIGHDMLAVYFLTQVYCTIEQLGSKIGCGKESDLYYTSLTENRGDGVMKLHRLGRTSFRNGAKNKRDYVTGSRNHNSNLNWLKMSALSASAEYKFMAILGEHKFRVPKVYAVNRHAVVMGLVKGKLLNDIKVLDGPHLVLQECLEIIVQLAERGLVHGDFNEFNIMIVDRDELVEGCGVVLTEEDEIRNERRKQSLQCSDINITDNNQDIGKSEDICKNTDTDTNVDKNTDKDTNVDKNTAKDTNRDVDTAKDTNRDVDTDSDDSDDYDHHEKVVMIDFPQMVSITSADAKSMFDRDVRGIVRYFENRYRFKVDSIPTYEYVCDKLNSNEYDSTDESDYSRS